MVENNPSQGRLVISNRSVLIDTGKEQTYVPSTKWYGNQIFGYNNEAIGVEAALAIV